MTQTTKPVRRETLSSIRQRGQSRPIVVELNPTWLTVRLKGTRKKFTATYDQLFTLAAKNEAAAAKAERASKRRKS